MANQLYIQEGVVSTGTKKSVFAQFFDMRKWATDLLIEYGLIAGDPCCTGGSSGINGNISNATYSVYKNLIANNTTSSTTTILDYGVNVFTTVTSTDYACKLPQPVTGKVVMVSNMGTSPLYIYPSNIGGKINNLAINAPAIVPADGKFYEFICIENPLPGAWTWSTPATNQIILGEMSVSHTTGTPSSVYGIGVNTPFSGAGCILDSSYNIVEITPGTNGHLFTPATATKTKVYSNIVAGDVAGVIFPIVVERITYFKYSATAAIDLGSSDSMNFRPTAGTRTNENTIYQAPVGTLSSPPNVGDTGTFYSEYHSSPGVGGDQLGIGGTYSGYYWRYAMNIPASAATKVYKFKIILEYY